MTDDEQRGIILQLRSRASAAASVLNRIPKKGIGRPYYEVEALCRAATRAADALSRTVIGERDLDGQARDATINQLRAALMPFADLARNAVVTGACERTGGLALSNAIRTCGISAEAFRAAAAAFAASEPHEIGAVLS